MTTLYHPYCRYFHQCMQYLLVLISYSWYVRLFLLACICGLDTQILKAAEAARSSYDSLIELFECIEHMLHRLKVITEIPISMGMGEILVKIVVELLSVLALATHQIRQGRFSESVLADTSR